jgi:hypothetical protein
MFKRDRAKRFKENAATVGQIISLIGKCKRVYTSCTSYEQRQVAVKFIGLAMRRVKASSVSAALKDAATRDMRDILFEVDTP